MNMMSWYSMKKGATYLVRVRVGVRARARVRVRVGVRVQKARHGSERANECS